MSFPNDKQKITELIKSLVNFPNTQTVRKLRRELQAQLDKITGREQKLVEREQAREQKVIESRVSRSNKLKKYHNYMRSIHDNRPEFPYSQIRRMYKDRKQGKDVSIPDVVWQNPSP